MIVLGNEDDLKLLYPAYESLFAEDERKSYDSLCLLMKDDGYKLLVYQHEKDAQRIGFAFVYHIEDLNLLWLDFIAIEPPYQSGGYGTRFFQGIIDLMGADASGMFMEVEKPTNDVVNQIRRLKYYERLGALYMNIDYRLPTPTGSLPMHLMYKPLKADALNREHVKSAIKSVYACIHRDIEGTELLYKEVVKSIGSDLFMIP